MPQAIVIPHFINAGSYGESYTNAFWQYELDNTYGGSGLDEYHKFTLTKPMNVKLIPPPQAGSKQVLAFFVDL